MTDKAWMYTAWAGNSFQDLEGWAIQNAYSTPYWQYCGVNKMIGGFNILGAKSALVKSIPLPPHYKMRIRVQFWKIDSWDGESFIIYVDGVNVYQKAYSYA